MENKIYQQSLLCKEFADKRIESCRIINASMGTEQTFVRGDIKGYESHLNVLKEVIKDKYPLIERQIAEAMGKYDSYPYRYQSILESIVKTIISLELQTEISKKKFVDSIHKSRKFFISHSSDDKIIVNGFIKEILKIGCGFKDGDIFCTLDPTAIRTGDDFREQIIVNMEGSDYILLFISENYKKSEVCSNELGASWAYRDKRVLPLVLPNVQFNQMGFLNIGKQGAKLLDRSKLDELYEEICRKYSLTLDWKNFNKRKDDFINTVNSLIE